MCILLTHSSENGRFGRSPKPSNPKYRTFSRLLRGLRFVSKLAVLPQGSRIFRIHILLNFEILLLEACCFQNSEGLEGLKEYAHSLGPDKNDRFVYPVWWQRFDGEKGVVALQKLDFVVLFVCFVAKKNCQILTH